MRRVYIKETDQTVLVVMFHKALFLRDFFKKKLFFRDHARWFRLGRQ
jgi:hypothetical protein